MTQAKEPPKSYKKKLKDAKTKEERVEMVRQAMEDGHSNKTAAVALGLSEKQSGVIAGIRFKNKIPSKHDAPHMGKPPPRSPEPEFKPFTKPVDMTLRFAGDDWAHQCREQLDEGRLCGYRQVEGEKYCPKHLPLHKK